MQRIIVAVVLLVGACRNPLDDLEFDFDFELFPEKGPAFFFRLDDATYWQAAADRCAVKQDGSLWCWSVESNSIQVQPVATSAPIQDLVAGNRSVCAIDIEKTAWCWNAAKQSSPEPLTARPSKIEGAWKSLSTGDRRICGIKNDGTLWCWGELMYNTGQTVPSTGDPVLVVDSASPLKMTDGTWVWVSAGSSSDVFDIPSAVGRFCGLRTDKTLWCYDNNADDGYPNSERAMLQSSGEQNDWESVHASESRVCGLTTDRRVVCYENSPHLKEYAGKWLSFSMHGATLCGVQDDHSLWCWGSLPGTGEIYSSHHTKERKKDWARVYVGASMVCAIKTDGTLYCLGLPGWLNFGGENESTTPILVDEKSFR